MEIDYREMADELKEFASMEETEVGEYWDGLANLHHRATDCASDEFLVALEKEILKKLESNRERKWDWNKINEGHC